MPKKAFQVPKKAFQVPKKAALVVDVALRLRRVVVAWPMAEYNMRSWGEHARRQISRGMLVSDLARGDNVDAGEIALLHKPERTTQDKEPIFAVRTATGHRMVQRRARHRWHRGR